jgi:3-isopropylmalate/(R)-2-methylmalate dehydratase small subunit
MRGNTWKYGNDVDTDQIIPSQYLLLPTIDEMKEFTFEPLDKEFPRKVKVGDILVCGENFGSGSSREQAPRVLKSLGVSAIVAKSFARIFFRNSINIGLPVFICGELYDETSEGDEIEIDVENGMITNLKSGNTYTSTKLPEHIMEILNANGLIEYLNNRKGE